MLGKSPRAFNHFLQVEDVIKHIDITTNTATLYSRKHRVEYTFDLSQLTLMESIGYEDSLGNPIYTCHTLALTHTHTEQIQHVIVTKQNVAMVLGVLRDAQTISITGNKLVK